MLWLKNFANIPPGQYYYSQGGRTFDSTSELLKIAKDVAEFRRGNNLPRASKPEAFEDIVVFTVSRLVEREGPNNEWVIDTDAPFNAAASQAASGGGCCGAHIG